MGHYRRDKPKQNNLPYLHKPFRQNKILNAAAITWLESKKALSGLKGMEKFQMIAFNLTSKEETLLLAAFQAA